MLGKNQKLLVGELAFEAYPHRSTRLFGDAFVLIIPVLNFVEFNLGGRLFLSEVLLLLALPFMFVLQKGKNLDTPLNRQLFLFGLLWLTSLMLSDVIQNTPFEDWTRGWAKVVFFLSNFASLFLLIGRRPRRYILFAVGLAVGQIFSAVLAPSEYVLIAPWKFGFGPAISLLLVVILQIYSVRGYRYFASTVLALMGLYNFYMDSRSAALLLLLAATYMAVRNRDSSRPSNRSAMILIASLGIGAVSINAIYSLAAGQGWLGEEQQTKYDEQAYGDAGVLLGGRGELLVSSQAVLDSPIIGHGSWARDPYYADLLIELVRSRGYGYGEGPRSESDLIPSHSYLMGTWVEAGLFGALFWVWGFVIAIRAMVSIFQSGEELVLLTAYLGLELLWSILFSPFGAGERLGAAYIFTLMLPVLERRVGARA